MNYSAFKTIIFAKISSSILIISMIIFSSQAFSKSVVEDNAVISVDEQRVIKLLEKAVMHVEKYGPKSVADFDSSAEFIDNELYVFALRVDGLFLASGGSSMVLKGDLVWNTPDAFGQVFFHRIIEKAIVDGKGTVEYYWTNPVSRGNKPKRTLFKRVGDVIIAVGYHPSGNTLINKVGSLDDIIIVMMSDKK